MKEHLMQKFIFERESIRNTLLMSEHPIANIVVIDDSPEFLKLINQYFKSMKNVSIMSYTNEIQFIHDLMTQSTNLPDLVIIDLNLSNLSGQIINQIIKQYYTDLVPVVYVSADKFESKDDVLFFKKPLKLDNINQMLKLIPKAA